jgi:hypothetical protein
MPPFCRSQFKSTLECYNYPWSSCTIYDALKPGALRILEQEKRERENHHDFDLLKSLDMTKDVTNNVGRESIQKQKDTD